jgi:hypothetical protein
VNPARGRLGELERARHIDAVCVHGPRGHRDPTAIRRPRIVMQSLVVRQPPETPPVAVHHEDRAVHPQARAKGAQERSDGHAGAPERDEHDERHGS